MAEFRTGDRLSMVPGLQQGQQARLLVEVQLRGPAFASPRAQEATQGCKQGLTILDLHG